MKLVLTYITYIESYYRDENLICFEYESVEKAKEDFEKAYEAVVEKEDEYDFTFANKEFYKANFAKFDVKRWEYKAPEIVSLEDWFEGKKIN